MAIPRKLLQDIRQGLSAYTFTQPVTLWRNIPQRDGIGGISMTWTKVADFRGILKNESNSEQIISEAITQHCSWSIACPVDIEVRQDDRIYLDASTPYALGMYFEVAASDYGKTDAIVQNVDLIQHQTGA